MIKKLIKTQSVNTSLYQKKQYNKENKKTNKSTKQFDEFKNILNQIKKNNE